MMYAKRDGKPPVIWYIGRPIDMPKEEFGNVTEVYADGHEFTHCIVKFNGLPTIQGANHAIWHGDFAKFIVSNLCLAFLLLVSGCARDSARDNDSKTVTAWSEAVKVQPVRAARLVWDWTNGVQWDVIESADLVTWTVVTNGLLTNEWRFQQDKDFRFYRVGASWRDE